MYITTLLWYNKCTDIHCDGHKTQVHVITTEYGLYVTALWSGISPLIFPVWLYLPEATPPPAKLSGSEKLTSPSTTARRQFKRGDVLETMLTNLSKS